MAKGFAGLVEQVSHVEITELSSSELSALNKREHNASGDPLQRPGRSKVSNLLIVCASVGFASFLSHFFQQPKIYPFIPVTQPLPNLKYLAQTPIDLHEELPPIGKNRLLPVGQVRYCLAQNIRLNGAWFVADFNNKFQMDQLNKKSVDYSNRCGKYRARQIDMQNAHDVVDVHQDRLMAEGSIMIPNMSENKFSMYSGGIGKK
jgi:hypothetical protein